MYARAGLQGCILGEDVRERGMFHGNEFAKLVRETLLGRFYPVLLGADLSLIGL
jgi:hypothetical protein